MDNPDNCLLSQTRGTAFRILFETGEAVEASFLASELGSDLATVEKSVDELDRQGLIRRNDKRKIVGSFGLSIVPNRDEISIEGRHFWTWCAKTSLGVLGAFGRGGSVISHSPSSGSEIRVTFEGASPQEKELVVFWPSSDFITSCSSVVEQVCPQISLFESVEAAEGWIATSHVPGEILPIEEATTRSIEWYASITASVHL